MFYFLSSVLFDSTWFLFGSIEVVAVDKQILNFIFMSKSIVILYFEIST